MVIINTSETRRHLSPNCHHCQFPTLSFLVSEVFCPFLLFIVTNVSCLLERYEEVQRYVRSVREVVMSSEYQELRKQNAEYHSHCK